MLGRNGGSKSQRMRKREGFEVFQNGSADRRQRPRVCMCTGSIIAYDL